MASVPPKMTRTAISTPSRTVGKSGSEGGGAYFEITCCVTSGVVSEISFRTLSCLWSQFAGMALCALVEKKTTAEALLVTPEDLKVKLIDLPLGRHHVPGLAIEALRNALQPHHS